MVSDPLSGIDLSFLQLDLSAPPLVVPAAEEGPQPAGADDEGPAVRELDPTLDAALMALFVEAPTAATQAEPSPQDPSERPADFEAEAAPLIDLALDAEPVPQPAQATEDDQPEEIAEQVLADAEDRALLSSQDEQVKQIGPLRIGIALFNIYLNEADELSRRLATALAEWAMEREQLLPDGPIEQAHALAGNSSTVGFAALSELARALEHALGRTQGLGRRGLAGSAEEAQLFQEAAEEIRRLLHQFAAGFLKSPREELLARLAAHEHAAAQRLRDSEAGATVAMATPGPDWLAGIDVQDHVDPQLFPIFEEEAQELLPALAGALRDWTRSPGDLAAADAAMRQLHTFKGGARLAGAMRLGELAHRLETEIERLATGGIPARVVDVAALLAGSDALEQAFDSLRARDAEAYAAAELASLAAAAAQSAVAPPPVTAPVAVSAPAAPEAPPTKAQASGPPVDWARFAGTPPAVDPAAAERSTAASQAAVRVRAGVLERMVNQAGEVNLSRARVEVEMGQVRAAVNDLSDNLERLRLQLHDIELQAETQMSSRIEATKASAQAFDPLEIDRFTRFQELTRMMAESVNDVATVQRTLKRTVERAEDELAAQTRLTRDLQADLLRTRMVEFDTLAERLHRVVRQAAKESGKQAELEIAGGSIEVDRGMLERLTPSFEHLLRNAVIHGIETPPLRSTAGKPALGALRLSLHQQGNEVGIELQDDGAGLDLARIRAKAQALGLPVTEGQEQALIFSPGFSTADRLTELAGRGVGLDVVRTEVMAVGGRVEVNSVAGQGTRFSLLLPLTTAVTQVLMLRCGDFSVAVPATLVERVRRVAPEELAEAQASGHHAFGDQQLPFFWLGALLQQSGASGEPVARTTPVVVVRSAQQRLALQVDEVLGHQEAVVKHLGPQLSRMPGLAGMSVLASGTVALIYNPLVLAAVYGDAARALSQASPRQWDPSAPAPLDSGSAARPPTPLVLVVDDSLTVRRVTQRLLVREGYRVQLAKDGLEALERVAAERPAVVLTDIEMPRMDGFELVRSLRADAALASLPVVVISSRIAAKHREHASSLGVDHYLGKPYGEDELLNLVRRLAQPALTTA